MIEENRYSRQESLPEVSKSGQLKLANAHVVCVGAGGLGNAVVQALVASGVGQISIVDADVVSLSNFARQRFFPAAAVGRPNVAALSQSCARQNAEVTIHPIFDYLSAENIQRLLMIQGNPEGALGQNVASASNQDVQLAPCDVVVDCTDDAATKYLLNQYCVQNNIPFVTSSLAQWSGYALLVDGVGCYRCLFPKESAELPTCAQAGVISTLPGLFGQLQASMVLQVILGLSESLLGKLWRIDLRKGIAKTLDFEADPGCAVCAAISKQTPLGIRVATMNQLNTLLDEGAMLLDVRTDQERSLGHMGGEHMPLDGLEQGLRSLDKNKHWVVYCHSGVRSELAAHWLCQAGFTQVSNLAGGYAAWQLQQQDF